MGFRSKKGMMGIGTLIIFIAVVLVAAVAAGVLISTSGSLQQKALITGSQAEEGVSTGLDVVSVSGQDASSSGTPHQIQYLTILARLNSGSTEISFNSTIITVDTEDTSQSIEYNATVSEGVLSATTYQYVVHYIKEGTGHEDGYISRGDVTQMQIRLSSVSGENEVIRVHIIPRTGTVTQVQLVTPATMTERRIFLWPT